MSEVLVNPPSDCVKKLNHLEFCLRSLQRETRGPAITIDERDSFLHFVNYRQLPALACSREIVVQDGLYRIICQAAGQCVRNELA